MFLDIMGFQQMLKKPEELYQAVADLKAVLNPSDREKRAAQFDVIQFSDLIVVAAKTDHLSNAVMIILRLMLRANALISARHIPIRGAVVCGDYFYKNEILISPALADAYKLESKFARYPRIIMSKSLTDYFGTLKTNAVTLSKFEADYESITMVDNDGFRFLNYLFSAGVVDSDHEQPEETDLKERANQLSHHQRFIIDSLKKQKDDSVCEKYIWMGNYHNRFLREDPVLPRDMKTNLFVDPKLLQLNH